MKDKVSVTLKRVVGWCKTSGEFTFPLSECRREICEGAPFTAFRVTVEFYGNLGGNTESFVPLFEAETLFYCNKYLSY